MVHQLLLPTPVQVTLPQEMGPQLQHTATVCGSGPNFRVVVMYGGMREFLGGNPISEITLLHLGECVVWSITCCMSRNIQFGKVPTWYGKPFVSKLVMTTLCKKWVTSHDEMHTSRDNFDTLRDELHALRNNCIASCEAMQDNWPHRAITGLHRPIN